MKALAETVRGLENLKEAYCDDVGTVSQLDTLKDEIVSFLTITNNWYELLAGNTPSGRMRAIKVRTHRRVRA